MRISRSVSRYALMVQFGIAALAGMGLHTLLQKVHAAGQGITAVAALCRPANTDTCIRSARRTRPRFYTQLAQEPGQGAVLNLPMNYDVAGLPALSDGASAPATVAYISRDDLRTRRSERRSCSICATWGRISCLSIRRRKA